MPGVALYQNPHLIFASVKTGTDISKAVKALLEGKLVAIPTETVYGLAANALNPDAVASIFEAKNRPSFDPLIVHISDWDMLKPLVRQIPEAARLLAKSFWPGPLTLVLPRTPLIPDLVTSGLDTVAIRMPDHPLTLKLIRQAGKPLAAPSANPFGYTSPTTAHHVKEQLGEKVAYILDGGPSGIGIESTIVKCLDEKVEILRLGGLPVEEIEQAIGRKTDAVLTSSSQPDAPGMLSSHYNPGKKLLLGDVEHLLMLYPKKKVGLLTFCDDYTFPNIVRKVMLSEKGDLKEAARNLFAALRSFDTPEIDLIIAERVPDTGLGRAINDRLKRAAHSR